MRAAGLAGNRLDFLIKLDGILLEFGDIRITIDRVDTARRVPGGTGGQLGPLKQHNILPAGFCQVIQNTGTDNTAANHNYLSMSLHRDSPS